MEYHTISRRKILQLSVPAAAVVYTGGITALFSCKNKTASNKNIATKNQPLRKPKKAPVQRGNPYAGKDEMFLHNTTKTLHYPYVFKTYDKLREDHITNINTAEWEKQLDENGAHFTRERSALIFEKLALKNFAGNITDDSLAKSAAILGRSFKAGYAKQNVHNWRGYHFLAQMIALNNTIPDSEKWTNFSTAINEAGISKIKKIPKRHAWIASQQLFDQRMQYIHQHNEEYLNRIKKRLA